MLGIGVQNLIRAGAQQVGNLADRADEQANGIDPDWAAHGFVGMDFVGIDFSTSIESLASHVNQYRWPVTINLDANRDAESSSGAGTRRLPIPPSGTGLRTAYAWLPFVLAMLLPVLAGSLALGDRKKSLGRFLPSPRNSANSPRRSPQTLPTVWFRLPSIYPPSLSALRPCRV